LDKIANVDLLLPETEVESFPLWIYLRALFPNGCNHGSTSSDQFRAIAVRGLFKLDDPAFRTSA